MFLLWEDFALHFRQTSRPVVPSQKKASSQMVKRRNNEKAKAMRRVRTIARKRVRAVARGKTMDNRGKTKKKFVEVMGKSSLSLELELVKKNRDAVLNQIHATFGNKINKTSEPSSQGEQKQ